MEGIKKSETLRGKANMARTSSTIANVVKGAGEATRSGRKKQMVLSAGGSENTLGNIMLVLLACVIMYMLFVILIPAIKCQ